MKLHKKILEIIFNLIYPLLSPDWVQRFLRSIGFKFPYLKFAQRLDYRGLVPFEVNGRKFNIQSHNTMIDIYIFWYGIFGVWEPTQLRLWSQLVNDADVVLDIGANSGVYSLIASTNTSAEIYAFEPVPVVRDMLEENIALNLPNTIQVESSVVADADGEETLYVPWQGWVDVASINKDFAKKFVREQMQEIRCHMVSIDSFLTSKNIPLDKKILCKIDVEGAEKRVLAGMVESLTKRDISFTAELLDSDFYNEVVSMLPDGYVVYAINESSKAVELCTEFVGTASNYYITKNQNAIS